MFAVCSPMVTGTLPASWMPLVFAPGPARVRFRSRRPSPDTPVPFSSTLAGHSGHSAPDEVQPALQPFAKLPRTTVIYATELTHESDLSKQRQRVPSLSPQSSGTKAR
jgi:hypothetical protein